MRILTGAEISSILRNLTRQDAGKLLDSLSTALAAYTAEWSSQGSEQRLHQPLRTVIQTREQHTTLIMPVSDSSTTAVKVATVPHAGDIAGAITIYSAVGELLGVLNAAEITAFRTALATMTVLTRWRAPDSTEVIVFGAGKQAEWHVRLVLLLVPGVKRVTVVNRTAARLSKFDKGVLDTLRDSHPAVQLETLSADGKEGYQSQLSAYLSSADIICGCTPSKEPLFTSAQLNLGDERRRFLSLIGSYKPEMQEVDTETIRAATQLWVDSKEACLEEAGELIRAKLTKDELLEVGELFISGSRVNVDATALTIFKCVGFALMDLTVAQALLDTAQGKGIGTVLDSF